MSAVAVALAVMTGGFFAAEPEARAADSKIAVIDLARAIFETEDGLRAQANLKKVQAKLQGDLEAKQREFMSKRDAYEKDKAKMSNDKRAQVEADLQQRIVEIQTMQMDSQREMQRQQSEVMLPIQQRVLGIVRRIAAQDGYEMVLEKSAVPYMRADLEITDRAIQMYNVGGDGGPAAGKPGPATTPAPKPGTQTAPPAAPKPAAPAPAPKK
ncbi:MAG TPA: OmpH family outer membrane protein [Polyangium sp.]|nr:OmpH family outer membrane protein [Polyangium sp.]